MDSILKKGVLLVSVTGIMTAFPMVVHAADIDDTQNIPAAESTQILEDCSQLRHMLLISRIITLCQEWELSRC